MQETSNVAVVNEETGSQAGPDSPRDEALGYADKASLQSALMELILNEGTSGNCFDKALEQIRHSFDAEGCAVVPVNEAGETCIQELRCAMPGASDPAVINFFSNVDTKHAYAHFRLQESMMPGDESALSGDYWCEELRMCKPTRYTVTSTSCSLKPVNSSPRQAGVFQHQSFGLSVFAEPGADQGAANLEH